MFCIGEPLKSYRITKHSGRAKVTLDFKTWGVIRAFLIIVGSSDCLSLKTEKNTTNAQLTLSPLKEASSRYFLNHINK